MWLKYNLGAICDTKCVPLWTSTTLNGKIKGTVENIVAISCSFFCNTRGLLQYVVHITIDAQVVAICNSYCNATKVRQKVTLLQPIHALLQYEAMFFATVSMTSATCQNCCNICLNITTKMYFVAIPSHYCNKMINSCSRTELLQYHYHITTPMHLVAIHGFYCNKMST